MSRYIDWFVRIAWTPLLILFLAACTTAPQAVEGVATTVADPAAASTSTRAPAATEPAAEPTPEVDEAVEGEDNDWTQTVTVDGDFYVLGNPAAPIRMIDYADFL